MNILTKWLRSYLPTLPVDDAQLAEDLTLRGIAVEGIFPANAGGARFEMDITTNRVDAMNHFGVAREAAAIYDLPLRRLEDGIAAAVPATHPGDGFPVRIEADDLCGRFTARIIRNVEVKPATGLIAEYFAALGQKLISGPVDATNFGWLAMGQPTHVFDLDTLQGGIVVRRAYPGERLKLLDGSEPTLTVEDLVVADEKKALALAGVMGGWDSRVTESTKNILVEAAWFDPAAIRASSRRHGLHTDASHRFERGADFNAAPLANNLVTRLVLEQSGGEVSGPLVDVIVPAIASRTANRPPVTLALSEVRRLLGKTKQDHVDEHGHHTSSLTEPLVSQYLQALGCKLEPQNTAEASFSVQLPSWRLDLEREIDLVEEIARVYGYNRFADTLPGWSGEVHDQPHKQQEAAIRSTLRALGYSEAISSTFASAEEAATFGDPSAGAVPMGNPLSEEAGMLRPALAAGMAGMLARNLARGIATVRLFELGTVFTGNVEEVRETISLACGATGVTAHSTLHRADDALLFEVKGSVETLLRRFGTDVRFEPATSARPLPPWVEPGRGAHILFAGSGLGVLGELSSAELAARKLRQRCVLAELHAASLFQLPLRLPVLRDLSRFQAVERDFSFILPDTVAWSDVEQAVRRNAPAELQSVVPAEIFRDSKRQPSQGSTYSLLLRLNYQASDRTLTDDELTAWSDRVTRSLIDLGGTQRA